MAAGPTGAQRRPSACRAAWVVPVAGPPIADGAIVWDGDAILDVGPARAVRERWASTSSTPSTEPPLEFVDLGQRAVLPGLVNAHTHLELSWMRGLVPPAASMPAWVRRLMSERRAQADRRVAGARAEIEREVEAAIDQAIADLVAAGTVAVGDIGNTRAAWGPLSRSPLAEGSVLFGEVLGFCVPWPRWWPRPLRIGPLERLVYRGLVRRASGGGGPDRAGPMRPGLAAHAPYSVAPGLFAEVKEAARRLPMPWASVHLAESREEVQFLADGSGPWRTLLEELGVWTGEWAPPACGPVEYLERVGFAHERMVCVHGTQLGRDDLDRLARYDAALVTCPRSNVWVGVGSPPLADFFASGVTVAVGTDSLASNDDLNLFGELAEMHHLAPDVSPRRLLDAATRGGARALGLEGRLGAIEAGKRPVLVAVDVPDGLTDVEASLVSGVEPARVRWLHDLVAARGVERRPRRDKEPCWSA